jgi:hypothetical protein
LKRQVWFPLLAIVILLSSALACDGSEERPTPVVVQQPVVPRGDRVLGIDVIEAEDGDYDAAMDIVQSVGAEVVSLSVFWDEIETEPMEYRPDPNWLEIANTYYSSRGVQVSLVISVIDTVNKRVPNDLANTPFDDPAMIERFRGLLDYVFSQIPDLELTSLAIGNEIDGYLGTDTDLWLQYQEFFEATSAYARTLHPGLLIGSKAMLSGLTGYAREELQALNQFSDVIMVTYYPLNDDFTVRDPSVVETDLAEVVAEYEGRPIFVLEAGYPSSSASGSSEEQQADFVSELFRAWDAHASQIPVLFVTWLTDLPQSSVNDLSDYYSLTDHRFAEYLRTLGLRTYPGSGRDKAAFLVLKAEAEARGW